MRVFCFLFIFLSWCSLAFAQNTPLSQNETLDRQIVFQKAYELLASVLQTADDLALVNNDFTGQEMQAFWKIRDVVLSDFQSGKKDRLVFSDDQSIFKIDPNQPIRTAATSSDPHDPIYVNLKVINDRSNQFELEDALQILVHEYGHKTTDKIQTVVDSVAAKIRNFLVSYTTRIQSPHGERLTMLALPNLVGNDRLSRLIAGKDAKTKFYLMSALLLQNSNRVSDLSKSWADFLGANPMFMAKKPGIEVNSNIKIWQMAFSKSSDSEMNFWVEIARDEVASPTGQMAAGDGVQVMARQISADFKILVQVDPASQSIKSMTYQQSLVPQNQLKASIEHLKRIDAENYEIGVAVKTPFDFKKAKLIFESESAQFLVPASYVWPRKDQILFNLKMPKTASPTNLITRAFMIDDVGILYFDQGLPLQTNVIATSAKPMKLQSIKIADGSGAYPVSDRTPVEASQARLVLLLDSEVELQEIRLSLKRTVSTLAPESFVRSQKDDDPALHGPVTIENKRTDLFFKYFDANDFTQVRKGSQLEVTLPISDRLVHLSDRTSRGALGTFFTRDEGERSIFGIEIVDTQLRTLKLDPSGGFSYQLISPEHPRQPLPSSLFRMEEKAPGASFCSKLR